MKKKLHKLLESRKFNYFNNEIFLEKEDCDDKYNDANGIYNVKNVNDDIFVNTSATNELGEDDDVSIDLIVKAHKAYKK